VNKPRDMLEFFRRSAPDRVEATPSAPTLEPTTRMLVLRRSQALVAGAAAIAALVLAFLLGYAAGAPGGDLPEVFVIRAADYGGDDQGMGHARKVKEQLEKMNLGDEVKVLESEGRTVVTVGSWLSDPEGSAEARALRDKLRGLKDSTQAMPFASAEFWRMKR